jgi:SAM-dependent methyltransferase
MRVILRQLYDDRYGQPDKFDVAECESCGFMSTEPRLTDADLPGLYSTYYPRRRATADGVRAGVESAAMATPAGRRRAKLVTGQWAAHYEISPGMRVLDYGCGDCASLLEIKAMGADPYGIEVDPNVRELADQLGVKVHVGALETLPEKDETFDAVTLSQVIEHVTDPEGLVRDLARKLKRGGKLVLTTPNSRALSRRMTGRRWLHWHIPFHQNHFHARVLRDMLERAGLRVDRVATFTPVPWWEYQAEMLLNPPKHRAAHPYFDKGESRLRATRIRSTMLRVARPLVSALAKVVDAFRMGDSLLIVATKT